MYQYAKDTHGGEFVSQCWTYSSIEAPGHLREQVVAIFGEEVAWRGPG